MKASSVFTMQLQSSQGLVFLSSPVGSFPTETPCALLHEHSIYTIDNGAINVRAFQVNTLSYILHMYNYKTVLNNVCMDTLL